MSPVLILGLASTPSLKAAVQSASLCLFLFVLLYPVLAKTGENSKMLSHSLLPETGFP